MEETLTALDEPINFRLGGNAGPYLGAGWSDPEAHGTWSVATVMSIRLRLSQKPGGALKLIARVLPFVAENHPAMRIQVVVNGVDLTVWLLTAPELQSVETLIDANLVGLDGACLKTSGGWGCLCRKSAYRWPLEACRGAASG
jgi:hypothetical protein